MVPRDPSTADEEKTQSKGVRFSLGLESGVARFQAGEVLMRPNFWAGLRTVKRARNFLKKWAGPSLMLR